MSVQTVLKKQKQDEILSVWLSFDLPSWFGLVSGKVSRIERRKLPLAVAITLMSMVQSVAGVAEQLLYGRRIRRASVGNDPVFVLGHWRSGTSLLHELMSLDKRHTYATNYHCFNAHHFLLTERVLKPILNLIAPSKRVQDNMSIDLDSPQEDEFGLCCMGAPSPYRFVAFPNDWDTDPAPYEIEGLSPKEQARWERDFVTFLKRVRLARPGRLIIKSPTHTFRVKTLLRLFPRAKFVHIVRNPYSVYSSTMHLWRSVCDAFALEAPDYSGLQQFVFSIFLRAHAAFDASRDLVPAGQLHEIRYEDLVRSPESAMQDLYAALGLSRFETEQLPALRHYFSDKAPYRKNKYNLNEKTIAEINRRWGHIFDKYGYEMLTEKRAIYQT